MSTKSNQTWSFILRLVSYVATAIAGMLGGAAI